MMHTQLRETYARLHREATAIIAALPLDQVWTPDMLAAVRAVKTDLSDVREQLDMLGEHAADIETRRAFTNYLRNGPDWMPKEDRGKLIWNSQGIATGLVGGFTVPEGFYGGIVDAQRSVNGMLTSGAEIIDTDTGSAYPVPMDNDTMNAAVIVPENTAMADAPPINFGQIVLGSYAYATLPLRVSMQLIQDAGVDMDAWLAGRLGVRLARGVNRDLTIGTGIGMPMGCLTAVVNSGLGYICPTGETVTLRWQDIVDLIDLVDPAYLPNCRFMLNTATLKILQLIVDSTGRPIWQLATGAGQAGTLYGYPYIINQAMPVPAPGATPIMFGDFSTYKIRRVKGASVARVTERYIDQGQVGFIGFQRWDGNLADAGTHPIAYLQQSAS